MIMSRNELHTILARFKSGETLVVVCNAKLWTEGFDVPSISCVVIARPTKSQPFYAQMIGRGTRLCPEEGKQNLLILDVVGVANRLDLVTAYTLDGLKLRPGESAKMGIDRRRQDAAEKVRA